MDDVVYLDEYNNPIDPSLVNSGEYIIEEELSPTPEYEQESLPNMAEPEQEQNIYGDGGILTSLASIPTGAASLLTKQVGSGMQFLGDLFGGGDEESPDDNYFQRFANETSNVGNYIQDAGADTYQDVRNTISPESYGGSIYDIGSGILSYIPSLVAGGPVKAAVTEGLKQGANFYGDLRDEEVDPQTAAEASLKDAGINSILNLGPTKLAYNPARSALTRYGIAPLLDAGLSRGATDLHLDLQEGATGREIPAEERLKAKNISTITGLLSGVTTAKLADHITKSTNSTADLETNSIITKKADIADSLLDPEGASEIQTTPFNGTDVPLPPEAPVNNAPAPVTPSISQDLGANVEAQASKWIAKGRNDPIGGDSSIKIRASEQQPVITQPKADEAPKQIQLQRQIAPQQVVEGVDGSILSTSKDFAFDTSIKTLTTGKSQISYSLDKEGQPLLIGIQTLPEAQGRGQGSKLLDSFIKEARNSGYKRISLESIADNEGAQARLDSFYKRKGFRQVGDTREFTLDLKDASSLSPSEQLTLFDKLKRREEIQKQRGSLSNRPIKDTSEALHTDEGVEFMDQTMTVLQKERQAKGKKYRMFNEGETPEIRDLSKERPKDAFKTGLGVGYLQKKLSLPYYKMKNNPVMRPAMEAANNIGVRQVNVGLEDAHVKLSPYFELTPQEKKNVNTSLIAAYYKGNRFNPTPENFAKLGNTEREIAGIMAYRNYLDVDARQKMKATLLKKNFDPGQVEAFISNLDRNYIPAGRYGDHVVRMMDADGNVMGVRYFDNAKDARAVALAAKLEGARVEIDKVPDAPTDAASSMPLNLVVKLNEAGFKDLDLDARFATKDGQPIRGYPKHLVSSKKIAGFSDDLERNISEYAYGLEKWKANADMNPILEGVQGKLANRPELHSWFKKWREDLTKPGGDLAALRRGFTAFYMGGSVRSAFVNSTQTFQNTFPKLVDEVGVGRGTTIIGGAHLDLLKYLTGKKLPDDMQVAFDAMRKDGTIDANAMREFTNRLKGVGSKSSFIDKALIFHSLAEKYNRSIAAISGLKAGKIKGLKGDALLNYSRDFVDNTQHVYSKWNKPEWGRGAAALPYQFKHYALSQLNFLSQLGGKGMAAYMAAQIGLGGLVGVPFAKLGISILEKQGYDPIGAAEKLITEGADYFFSDEMSKKIGKSVTKGAFKELTGADISGSAGLGDIVQLQEGGLGTQLGSVLLGPVGNVYDRVEQAKRNITKYDDPVKALEKLLPVSVSGVSQAINAANSGAFKSAANNTLVPDPTNMELALKALGFSPKRLTDAYQTEHSKYIKKENDKNSNENINFKVAKALEAQDENRLASLYEMAAEKGIEIDDDTVEKYLEKWTLQKAGMDDLEMEQ